MAVIIEGTEKNSIAQKLGICDGSELVSINGKQVNDVLDYGFYSAERELTLLVCTKDGMERSYFVKKGENEQLGIESKSFLMDSQH
ncbi:MAG: PDZ domain-containing protein, partial [Oscillospiraceae bacterium]